ncbi:ATP-dependent zinc protease family protein [Vibrio rumoiensis]|uniref:ATP-dependent Zn protease n=1 Tax=Vibrio rumoiensis 1S-45 TaxID=1188252 RepID=A0A1E5E1C5_9VIBR|nr:ATP-dependent zinc protease [Vibrio rumoiensis]OEF24826.1 ATP-dependent Zn protease [Vibrio rumoiensis 1S-45]
MLKYTITLAVFTLLSGCALLGNEEYSQKTIDAVSKSEQNITNRIAELDSNMDKQTDYIDSLESEIINLSNEVELLKKHQQRYAVSKKSTQAATTPPSSSNVVVADLEPQSRPGMVTLGSLEKVYIDVVKSDFTARVDTGATTSSINAVDMQEFERNGKKWVKFHVSDNETEAKDRKWVEAPIVRHVKIRQSSTNSLERRPVVELWIKIGSVHEKAQFTLADRSQMDYPILLGREFIQDVAFVDVSREFIESKSTKK